MKRPRVYEIKPCRSASAAGGGNNRVSGSATAASQKGYQAPAADKALDILELLAEQRVPMSGADIARGLGRTIGEIFRMLSYQEIGAAAMLSRAVGGVSQGKVIFSLPGSTKAVRLGMEKLILPQAGHLYFELHR